MPTAIEGDTSETTSTNDTPAPKYVTVDDLGKIVNAAVSSQLKRLDLKKIVTDALAEHQPKPEPKPEPDPADKKVDPVTVKLQQQVEALTKQADAERQARLKAEHAQRAERAHAALRDNLSKHVRPEAVAVLAKAFAVDLEFDEEGAATLPLHDGTGRTSIDAVIDAWSKSKDASVFVPPPSAGGSGTPRTATSQRGIQSVLAKPREQWTAADREAYMAHRVSENSSQPGILGS